MLAVCFWTFLLLVRTGDRFRFEFGMASRGCPVFCPRQKSPSPSPIEFVDTHNLTWQWVPQIVDVIEIFLRMDSCNNSCCREITNWFIYEARKVNFNLLSKQFKEHCITPVLFWQLFSTYFYESVNALGLSSDQFTSCSLHFKMSQILCLFFFSNEKNKISCVECTTYKRT